MKDDFEKLKAQKEEDFSELTLDEMMSNLENL